MDQCDTTQLQRGSSTLLTTRDRSGESRRHKKRSSSSRRRRRRLLYMSFRAATFVSREPLVVSFATKRLSGSSSSSGASPLFITSLFCPLYSREDDFDHHLSLVGKFRRPLSRAIILAVSKERDFHHQRVRNRNHHNLFLVSLDEKR